MGPIDIVLIVLFLFAVIRDSRLGEPDLADSLRRRAGHTRALVAAAKGQLVGAAGPQRGGAA